MNALYYVNKIVGVAFGITLLGLTGYQAVKWRNEAVGDANRRLKQRMQQISEETRAEFERNSIDWDKVKFNAENLHGFNPGAFPMHGGSR